MKKKKGIKKANSIIAGFLKIFFRPALYLIYRFRFDRSISKHIQRPCIILSNHQTVIDQFAVSMGFKFAINYVASDTIFRHGLLSKLMVALVRPIPFSKGSSDIIAVKNMMSVIADGGCVAMFPSGNRSYFGKENKIVNGVGKLVKRLNAPLVLMNLQGGYFTKARWQAKTNRGKMIAKVVKTFQTDELASMSNEELDTIIQKTLSFNDFEYNQKAQIKFRGKHKAEYLESVLFYCPNCSAPPTKNEWGGGGGANLRSQGNDFFCQDCQMRVRLNQYGFFERVENAESIPETILEWGEMQLNYIKSFDFSPFTDKPLFVDREVSFMQAERAKKEHFIGKGDIMLYADRISVCGNDFLFTDISFTLQGVRKLTIYKDNEVYAVKVNFRTNLFKYMVCGYHLKHKLLNTKEEYYGY